MLERYIKLLPVGYDKYDYLGNPQLKPETNNEVDLTFHISQKNMGDAYINFFYSYVQDYIAANLLPSSVVTPQSQGVLGVKQFYNTDYITSKGFEFGYKSPGKYKLGAEIIAAYTYGVIPSVTKYIIEGKEVVDAVEIKNDALPEIPPFEATLTVDYKLLRGNLVPRLSFRAVAAQRHTSSAFYESETPGFFVTNFSVRYKISRNTELNTGVTNIFDRSYYEHLNRRIIGTQTNLYEPGRVLFATIYVNI
jgi:iron complex outermembrane receptor protein